MNQKRFKMLEEIQAIGFVLIELNLYLDTHPDDERALREFNSYGQKLQRLKTQYEALYGPLLSSGFSPSQYPWRWIEEPWPWDM